MTQNQLERSENELRQYINKDEKQTKNFSHFSSNQLNESTKREKNS